MEAQSQNTPWVYADSRPASMESPPLRLQDLPPGSRVLLAVTDRIGDALFRTPSIRLLARFYPDLQFDALAFGSGAAEVLRLHPDLCRVFELTDPVRIGQLARGYDLVISMRSLNKRRYLQKLDRPFISYERTQKNTPKAEDILQFTLRHLLPRPVASNEIDRNYVLRLKSSDHSRIQEYLHSAGISRGDQLLIGIHPGCASVGAYRLAFKYQWWWHHRKVWPTNRFAELAKRLIRSHPSCRIVLIGSPDEAFLIKRLTRSIPGAVDMCGFSIAESAALMDRLALLICNDSGPMHLACARGTPLLALCGNAPMTLTQPFPPSPQFRVIEKNRMKDITVEEAFLAAQNLLVS